MKTKTQKLHKQTTLFKYSQSVTLRKHISDPLSYQLAGVTVSTCVSSYHCFFFSFFLISIVIV